MAIITVAFPQTGSVRFDKNAITPSNSTQRSHIPSRFQRSSLNPTRKMRRIGKVGVVKANSGGVIEKEHEFKPSFEEYLKAMETVKSRREKRQGSAATPPPSPSSRSDSREQITVQKAVDSKQDEATMKSDSKEAQIVGKTEEHRVNMKRGSEISPIPSRGNVNRVAVKDVRYDRKKIERAATESPKEFHDNFDIPRDEIKEKWIRKKSDSERGVKHGKYDSIGVERTAFKSLKEFQDDFDQPGDETKQKWIRKRGDSKETKGFVTSVYKERGVKHGKYDSVGVERAAFESLEEFQDDFDQPRDELQKKWVQKKSDSKEFKGYVTSVHKERGVKHGKFDSVGVERAAFKSPEKYHDDFDEPRDEVQEKWVRKKSDSKEMKGYVTSVHKERGVKHEKFDSLGIERAAFKSLEEFQDVCDQPRVSRVDMEERIQRLAKCLNGASIDTPEWSFSKMMRSAKIRFADFSMIRLIQILGNYGNWRRVLQVIEWMQSRERFKSNRLRHIYTAALDALGKARRPVEALNVFHTMQQHLSTYPDSVAYHCIAVTLGQASHMRELFQVIDSMKSHPKKKLSTNGLVQKWDPRLQPDIIVYNAVLNACVRQKNLEGAFWVLQELKQQGQQPNSITYGLVMEVMLACEKYNLVHEFFQKMQKSFIPNSLTYKVVVNTLGKERKVDEAILAVKDMERRGIVGSAGLYYDLARCLCSAGRCQEALVQIDKICKVANKPLVVTFTGLIQACLDSGHIESGIHIFNHMHNFCSPNLVTYNIILKGFLDHHRFEEARELFYKLLEKGNRFTSKVENKNIVLPDTHTFNLMLDACFVNQRWDDLEFFYSKMLQHGYHFNAKRHSRMILEACKGGKVNLLETTWNHLITGNQIPPTSLVQEMFYAKVKQGDFVGALSCVAGLPSTESHKYSRDSWLRIFRDHTHLFGEETLFRLVDGINTLSLRNEEPNMILRNLMKSCKVYLRTE